MRKVELFGGQRQSPSAMLLSAGSASPQAAPVAFSVYFAISARRRLMGKFLLGGPSLYFRMSSSPPSTDSVRRV